MKVCYESVVFSLIAAEIKKYGDVETGGILLGTYVDNEIHIIKATDGGSKAIREPYYFKADADYVEMLIDMEYANSGGVIVYIGEWHTHPQIYPTPSELDLISLQEIVADSGKIHLLLIVGAVGFHISNLQEQTIHIIKHPNESGFSKALWSNA